MALAERTDPRLGVVDRVLHRTSAVAVGAFRCSRTHPLFGDSGPIENDVFVFPRTRVSIAHAGGRRFTADATVVTLYNRGQLYARGAIDDRDHCDYFAVDRDLALDVARAHDPDVGERPFHFDHTPSPAGAYLQQRALFEALARDEPLDPLAVEERVVGLLDSVLAAAYAQRARATAPGDSRDDEEIARRARLVLGARFASCLSLNAVAREVGVSRGRLCRAFRRRTGTTLHAYREQLRLRHALEILASPQEDLTTLALDLGYSSHSHFSANFRGAFGLSPSAARERLSAAGRPPARPRSWTRERS
jgi:AraC family transcriptional regulator